MARSTDVTNLPRASLRQVAERAHVSHITVSRVLGDHADLVAVRTRESVLRAVRELNYLPVAPPSTQKRRVATRVLGLVFDRVDAARDYVGTQTFVGLRDAAAEHGYDLLSLLRAKPDWALDRDEVGLIDGRTDGLIFINPCNRGAVLSTLVRHGVPIVACYSEDVPPGVATVMLDTIMAMRLAVQHLWTLGHRRIACLAGPYRDAASLTVAFEQAARALGVEPLSVIQGSRAGDWRPDRAAIDAALQRWVQEGITAVACDSDHLAIALWRRAEKLGVRIPEHLSLTGVNDLPVAAQHRLTTVRFPFARVGRTAIATMIEQLDPAFTAAGRKRLPVELIVRGSTMALRA